MGVDIYLRIYYYLFKWAKATLNASVYLSTANYSLWSGFPTSTNAISNALYSSSLLNQ